jgi:hypothetical protein
MARTRRRTNQRRRTSGDRGGDGVATGSLEWNEAPAKVRAATTVTGANAIVILAPASARATVAAAIRPAAATAQQQESEGAAAADPTEA